MNNHFKIIIPFYNAEKWIKLCIRSVKAQSYRNFECIIIDDISTDKSVEVIKKEIFDDDRFKLIINEEKAFALKNIYDGINYSKPCKEDIIITLDGDDWLAGKDVLKKVNDTYNEESCWITYGSYIEYPSKNKGKFSKQLPPQVITAGSYRDHEWCTSHLRTFKYHLWSSISTADLLNSEGKFYKMTWDLAFMFPMLEMAGLKSHYISSPLYIYNMDNPLNDHKVDNTLQLKLEKEIRLKKRYELLQKNRIDFSNVTFIIPIFVDSEDRLFNLTFLLKYLNSNFITNIKILEATKTSSKILDIISEHDNIDHQIEILKVGDQMHRSKYLNIMLAKTETDFVVNQDVDVLIPISSYTESISEIEKNGYDLIYPFFKGLSQKMVFIGPMKGDLASSQKEKNDYQNTRNWFFNFMRDYRYDLKKIEKISTPFNNQDLNLLKSERVFIKDWNSGFGHCSIFKTKSYKDGYGENENIISYGPDDFERYERFKSLGYKISHLNGEKHKVYHLEHYRNSDSNASNIYFQKNNEELEKIKSMTKEEIHLYFSGLRYTKDRGFLK